MVVWAVVLVPMWLRRHDAVTESRSVDRFSTAMRVLSRRPPPGGGTRAVVMPRRPAGSQEAQVSRGRRIPVRAPVATRPSEGRAQLQMRRARVLAALAGLAGLTFLFAVAGVTGWWLHLLVDLLLVGFVVHLRLQVVRSRAMVRPRRRPVPAAERALANSEQQAAGPPVAAEASAAAAEPLAEQGWEPVSVPLPTYVTAPVVVRPPRAPLLPAPAAERFEPDDAEIEVLYQRRWAVND